MRHDHLAGSPVELMGVPVDRARKILAVLIVAENMDYVKGPPGWRIHQLSGDRRGTWSLSVSGNWRITFDVAQNALRADSKRGIVRVLLHSPLSGLTV